MFCRLDRGAVNDFACDKCGIERRRMRGRSMNESVKRGGMKMNRIQKRGREKKRKHRINDRRLTLLSSHNQSLKKKVINRTSLGLERCKSRSLSSIKIISIMSTTPNSNNATPVAENSGAIETAVAASDEVDSKTPASGKKDRFLPRVRLLLTKEYEKVSKAQRSVIRTCNVDDVSYVER